MRESAQTVIDQTPNSLLGSMEIVEKGQGFIFYENFLSPESLERLAAEAHTTIESPKINKFWQIDKESDTADAKARFRTAIVRGSLSTVDPEELRQICPVTQTLLDVISAEYGKSVVRAQFMYYEPHTAFPPHRDGVASPPVLAFAIGLEGVSDFTIHPSKTVEIGSTTRTIKPGDAALLETGPHEPGFENNTREHSVTNKTEEPRISLAVFLQ